MAHEDFITLVERVLCDAALQRRVQAIDEGPIEDQMHALIGIAADEGLEFTDREVDELFLLHAASELGAAGTELSEGQLELVAGGGVGGLASQEMQRRFSLQYLGLQVKIAQETREFNLLSNIMKTRHEAAKNAINNVR
jgi:hypothetical protein